MDFSEIILQIMDQNQKSNESSEGEEKVIIEEVDDSEEDIGMYLKDGEYNVEKILEMKIKNGEKLYFVKWEGYPSSQNTWEPRNHLSNVDGMVDEFEAEFAKRKTPKLLPKKSAQNSDKTSMKENQNRRQKIQSHESEDIITKKIKRNNDKGESGGEELQVDIGFSPYASEKGSLEFDFSDDEKRDIKEDKSTPIMSKKETKTKLSDKANRLPKQAKDYPSKKSNQVSKKKDRVGCFKYKDKPSAILGIKPGKNNEFYFLVEWEKRNDGIKPDNSHVSNEEFRLYDPNFLFDFYESKIVIFAQKQLQTTRDKGNPKDTLTANTNNVLNDNVTKPTLSNNYSVEEPKQANNLPKFSLEHKKDQKREDKIDIEQTRVKNDNQTNMSMLIEDVRTSTKSIQPEKLMNQTLEDIVRDLDFQSLEENQPNFLNPQSDDND